MMNRKWPKWIFGSIVKHFTDAMNGYSIPIYVEGEYQDDIDDN
jgi:hypothetical protein